MSFLVSANPPIAGAFTVKRYAGFGIRGADISATGDNGGSPALNDGISADAEYYWRVVTPPASGTLEIFPDLTFDHSGAADGTWPWVYELFSVDGSLGQATVTDVFGTVSHEITISGSQQSNTVDSVAIQQAHLITSSNSQQVNTVSSVVATQSGSADITISDSQQSNTVSSVAIQQVHLISISGASQSNSVSSVAIQSGTITHNITIASASQRNTLSSARAGHPAETTIRERISVKSPISRIANIASPVSKRIVVQSRTGVMA